MPDNAHMNKSSIPIPHNSPVENKLDHWQLIFMTSKISKTFLTWSWFLNRISFRDVFSLTIDSFN